MNLRFGAIFGSDGRAASVQRIVASCHGSEGMISIAGRWEIGGDTALVDFLCVQGFAFARYGHKRPVDKFDIGMLFLDLCNELGRFWKG